MPEPIVVAGTDTGVGKTVFAAALTLALDGCYFKPVQSGGGPTDAERARELTGLPPERFLPERYAFSRPLSPHRAAELDGVPLDPGRLRALPSCPRPLVVELAGGLLVPLTRSLLQADLLPGWGAPVVLCARTSLGTINHSLLSISALRERGVRLLGVAFIGEANEDSERTICELGRAPRLGRLPPLPELTPRSLRAAFDSHFSAVSFLPLEARR